MADIGQAGRTQLANIEKKTGKSLPTLAAELKASGLVKHGALRTHAMAAYGLGYGDANTLVHVALQSDGESAARAAGASTDDVLDAIYTGKKAHHRPIHDAIMIALESLEDVEIVPKKGYVSLRRKKQFAMLGPKTNDRFELGVNLKDALDGDRFVSQKPGGMCQYIASLGSADEVDDEIVAVLQRAYEAAV
ncbi:DUF4287 domain-containing protein [bacterium]|nr:DUF4287 domain-containing protein [bacterium]